MKYTLRNRAKRKRARRKSRKRIIGGGDFDLTFYEDQSGFRISSNDERLMANLLSLLKGQMLNNKEKTLEWEQKRKMQLVGVKNNRALMEMEFWQPTVPPKQNDYTTPVVSERLQFNNVPAVIYFDFKFAIRNDDGSYLYTST